MMCLLVQWNDPPAGPEVAHVTQGEQKGGGEHASIVENAMMSQNELPGWAYSGRDTSAKSGLRHLAVQAHVVWHLTVQVYGVWQETGSWWGVP